MGCTHHWVLESPGQARERWERGGNSNGTGPREYWATCKNCGEVKPHKSSREIDNILTERAAEIGRKSVQAVRRASRRKDKR